MRAAVDDARLDDGVAIAEVDFVDCLHPREDEDHAAADRGAAAGEARAGTARHEGHARGDAELHDAGDLLGRSRKDGHLRRVLFEHERVALVDQQFGMGVEDVVVPTIVRSRSTKVA